MGIFGAFLLAQIRRRQREKNPKNIANVLLGLMGVMGPWAWAGSLVSHSPLSSGSWLSRVAVFGVLVSTSAFKGQFLGLISFEHANTVCLHQPLWRHPAEVLYQPRSAGSLNAGWGCALLWWSPALLWQVAVPVSACGHGGVGLLGALVSAGKAWTESHCPQGEVTAVGWQQGLQFCCWESDFPPQDLISLRVSPRSLYSLEAQCHISNSSFGTETIKGSKRSRWIKPWVFLVWTITWGREEKK